MNAKQFLRSTLASALLVGLSCSLSAEEFRVRPYLQNPAADAMTVRWLSNADKPGTLTVETPDGPIVLESKPSTRISLIYNPIKPEPGGPHPDLPFLHSLRVTGLKPGMSYPYSVQQGEEKYSGTIRTVPSADQPIRFVCYSDSETEPESSTTPGVDWPAPPKGNRPAGIKNYLVNQTLGYQENCRVITERNPNFILVAGDLVETGGEQRDWDEYWRHNAGDYGHPCASIPMLAAIGNHENFAGPGGGYSAEGANFGTGKYLTYFEHPSNGSANPLHHGRYYRLDYGPITLITLDSSDGLPHQTASDTNHNLEGSHAPDYNPGSEQYKWLETQLADAQKKAKFTFVSFHHTMYGSGPHSVPFGQPGFSGQSGIAMRVLKPLLYKYGVDALICGHDELIERSEAPGSETLPNGSSRPHKIEFYDVGNGGDGLRGPSKGFDNPYRKFLAHDDVEEVWKGKQLISGGKHYGHVEVNVAPDAKGVWKAEFSPVYVFPITDEDGNFTGKWDRRVYDDVVTISADG